jgi:hypothetical protein
MPCAVIRAAEAARFHNGGYVCRVGGNCEALPLKSDLQGLRHNSGLNREWTANDSSREAAQHAAHADAALTTVTLL